MQIRLTTIAILATLTAAAIFASPAWATRSCGTTRIAFGAGHGSGPVRLTVLRGRVSCAQTRTAMRNYFGGHGTLRGPANGPRSQQTIVLPGGWRCGPLEQGIARCMSGGSNYLNARDAIEGFLV
jgi:hypothetical protein